MRKSTFAGIIGLSLLATSALAQTEYEFSYEGWTGHKRANDPDNGCIMGKHVTKDVYFVVYANANEGFGFGVSISSWDLQVGEEWSGSVTFDDHEPILLTGTVIEPEIVLFLGGAEEDSLAPLLSSSRQMRLSYGHSKFGLSLKGSSKALDLLGDCAENRLDQSSPHLTQQQAQPGPSLKSLPIKSGYYALTGGTCAEGFGPNTIYTDGKTLSWPSSGCRFEYISQTGPSTYQVKQTCGQSDDDIETELATYSVSNKISFSLKSAEWETKGNYCEPQTLPVEDRERADPPIYAQSSLGQQEPDRDRELASSTRSERATTQGQIAEQSFLQNDSSLTSKTTAPIAINSAKRQLQRNDASFLDRVSPGDVIDGELINHLKLDEWEKVYKKLGKQVSLTGAQQRGIEDYVTRTLHFYEVPAQFRNLTAVQKFTEYYIICGLVNGKNQFGVSSGFQPFRMQFNPADNRMYFFQSPLTHPGRDGMKQCAYAGIGLQ
ncbi:hypothetical protein [Brucella pseudogrignonensis]|uniref:hypothetical protein n=1 Tax=Brucella pseudogrignonensis TaxID=419475 RepID=UPI000CFBA3DD|nr:hypothetical protein [Brucella pseudogrignonensis]MQP40966.1 hypothetical protein [Ochrobactrum sp. MYb237]PQZ40919.1 hypothetical protein CQ059_16860 [Brucella pseudogrignonensis]PRA40362.1 hypothetical protein CQ063_12295 [Brucella pseudogrignonensis]PRA68955.1 hypothetical protein CQ055_12180 [Brucella pseudogrignonensis]